MADDAMTALLTSEQELLHTHLARRVFRTPLAIRPQKAAEIIRVLGPRLGYQVEVAPAAGPIAVRTPQAGGGGIAVLPIFGTLVKRASGMDALSGLTSVETLTAQFRALLADRGVDGILLQIDSDGGEVAGIADFADEVYRARGSKPGGIWAVADEGAFSAAYWIASAAEQVVLPRTAGVGSIGVIAVHVDQSQFDQARGMQFTIVKAGAKKDAFNPHAPLSDDAREALQADVDQINGLFTAAVARNRGIEAERVKGYEAGTFQGPEATKADLADRVETFDAAMQRMRSELQRRRRQEARAAGGRVMQTDNQTGTGTADNVVDLAAEREKFQAEATQKAAAAAKARVKGISDACQLAGCPEQAATYIAGDLTPEAVAEDLLRKRAEKDAATQVSGAHLPGAGGTGHVVNTGLMDECKKRIAEADRIQRRA